MMNSLHLILLILLNIQISFSQKSNVPQDLPIPPGIPINAPTSELLNRIKEINLERNNPPIPDSGEVGLETNPTFELISAPSESMQLPMPVVPMPAVTMSAVTMSAVTMSAVTMPAVTMPAVTIASPTLTVMTRASITSDVTLTASEKQKIVSSGADSLEIKALGDKTLINSETILKSTSDKIQPNNPVSVENRIEPVTDDPGDQGGRNQENQTQSLSGDKIALIVVSVSIIVGALVVGLIYFGLPKFKSWRKSQVSSQKRDPEFDSLPDWHNMVETHSLEQLYKHDDLVFTYKDY